MEDEIYLKNLSPTEHKIDYFKYVYENYVTIYYFQLTNFFYNLL